MSKKVKIYIPDIECDSCFFVLDKVFKKQANEENFNYKIEQDGIEFEGNIDNEKINGLISKINQLGYRASLKPYDKKGFRERFKDFLKNKHKYRLEYKLINYFFGLFFVLSIINLFFVFAFKLPFVKYIPYFLYLNISLAIIISVIWHFLSYKTTITCMTGMMIGMTFGMQSGMMIGYILGVTNGYFTGALIGMLLGFVFGFLTGKCCGVMGAMQGAMSGIMGGTMGAMISVMLLNDNLQIFSPIYILLNAAIMLFLSIMMYEELVENKNYTIRKIDFTTVLSYSVIALIILLLIIYFGPKSVVIL